MFYILLIWVDKEFIQTILNCPRDGIRNSAPNDNRTCVVRSPLLLLYTESPAYTIDTMDAGLWVSLLLPPGYLGLPVTQMEFPQPPFLCQRRQWQPTPVLLPGNSHGRRSLVGCSPWGLRESDTTEWLHFTFHFHALEKEMATHSSVLAWRIPGTGEPGGLSSLGSYRVGHDWSDLAAAAAFWWV